MGAALWLAEEVSADSTLSALDRDWLTQSWAPSVSAWLRGVASMRPTEGDEEHLIEEMLRLLSQPFGRIERSSLPRELRNSVSRGFEEIERFELTSGEVERKLALRHIGRGVDALAELLATWKIAFGHLPDAVLADSVEVALSPATLSSMSPTDRLFLRLGLEIFVAVETVDGDLESLTWWARRVAESGRETAAWLRSDGGRLFRAEAARLRARHAWDGWTEGDVAQEVAPWSSPRPASR